MKTLCHSKGTNSAGACRNSDGSASLAGLSTYFIDGCRHFSSLREQITYWTSLLSVTVFLSMIHLLWRSMQQSSSVWYHNEQALSKICRKFPKKRSCCRASVHPILQRVTTRISFLRRLLLSLVPWGITSARTTGHALVKLASKTPTLWSHGRWCRRWHTL